MYVLAALHSSPTLYPSDLTPGVWSPAQHDIVHLSDVLCDIVAKILARNAGGHIMLSAAAAGPFGSQSLGDF